MANDPNLQWDGQQWLRWDGAHWIPSAGQGVAQAPTPAPQNQPPPPPKRTSNKGWIIGGSIAAAVVVVLLIIAVVVASISSTSAQGSIGQPVRDGNLEFTVTSANVANDAFANGTPSTGHEYFVATVTVKNVGTQSELLSPVNQLAVIGASQYKGFAFVVNNKSSGSGKGTLSPESLLLTPGATTSVQIPWTLPVGIKVSYLELHTSSSSSGARINVN